MDSLDCLDFEHGSIVDQQIQSQIVSGAVALVLDAHFALAFDLEFGGLQLDFQAAVIDTSC
jgi:hypothetical protein